MAITTPIRNLQFQSGDPGEILSRGRQLSSQVGEAVPSANGMQAFNLALLNLLRQHQQLGTRGFAEQGLQASESQARRVLQPTSTSLVGASPDVQTGVRSADVQAIQPTITGANQSQQTFGEQIRSLGDAISQAGAIGQWLQSVEQEQTKSARDLIFNIPAAVKKLPDAEKRALEQKAGLQKGIIDLIPEPKVEKKTQVIDLPDGTKALIDLNTGDTIKTYGSSGGVAQPGTDAQKTVAQFARRVVNSNRIITQNENQLAGISTARFYTERHLPSVLQSTLVQAEEQAERDFVNAQLRKESGAVINPSEFESARLQYFPQPGDSQKTIDQKRVNRQIAMDSLVKSAGIAISREELEQLKSGTGPFSINQGGSQNGGGVFPSAQAQENVIRVRRKSDGKTGRIPLNEFNPKLYDKL